MQRYECCMSSSDADGHGERFTINVVLFIYLYRISRNSSNTLRSYRSSSSSCSNLAQLVKV